MTVNVFWDNDKHTAIRMELIERWTWSEVQTASEQIHAMMEKVNQIVDIIIDMSITLGAPPLILTETSRLLLNRHPNTGTTVFVGASEVVSVFWHAFSQAYGEQLVKNKQYHFAQSLTDARALLTDDSCNSQV